MVTEYSSPRAHERKRLLQECLPGVTLYDNAQSHHRRQASQEEQSYGTNRHSVQDYQTQTYFSNKKSQLDDQSNNKNNTSIDESSIHILWIGNDDGDDPSNYDNESSLRQAAALASARRHAEQTWILCFKIGIAILLFFMVYWSQWKTESRVRTPHRLSSDRISAPSSPLSSTSSSIVLLDDDVIIGANSNSNFKPTLQQQQLQLVQDEESDDRREAILEALKNLDEEIKGDIILFSNKTKFIEASQVWQQQPSLFHPPLAVVQVHTAADVELALPILAGLSRDYQLDFRIRSGGHSYISDFNTAANGVMLSLDKLNSVDCTNLLPSTKFHNDISLQVNQDDNNDTSKIITIQPGLKIEEFMRQVLDQNGYSGIVASAGGVGMGGFILGGGYGLQSRMYGLAIDNVVGMNVVLTNGQSKDVAEGDDLFWALRGAGGGNLGVVTSFDYRVYPSHDIKLEASVKVTLPELIVFLRRLGAMEHQLRPEFTVQVHGGEVANGTTTRSSPPPLQLANLKSEYLEEEGSFVTISMFWMGSANPEVQTGMNYIKTNIVPLFSSNTTRDSVVYYYFSWSGMSRQREQDDSWKSVYSAQSWNGFLLPNNNTEAVWADIESSLAALLRYTQFASPKIELWGGEIAKSAPDTTAFPYRNALYNIAIELVVPRDTDTATDEANLIQAIWPSIARHLDGVYINNAMSSLSKEEYPGAYWGCNLERLKQLKQQYDPFHVLSFSQCIPELNVSMETRF